MLLSMSSACITLGQILFSLSFEIERIKGDGDDDDERRRYEEAGGQREINNAAQQIL